ncbi:hypothetical protein MASR2M64_00600 [Candidatus Cloacimonadota bacterium]
MTKVTDIFFSHKLGTISQGSKKSLVLNDVIKIMANIRNIRPDVEDRNARTTKKTTEINHYSSSGYLHPGDGSYGLGRHV